MLDLSQAPPERWKNRVWDEWRPSSLEWCSTPFHEAGHVVLMEYFGLKPFKAVAQAQGSGYVLLSELGQVPPPHGDETVTSDLLPAMIAFQTSIDMKEAAVIASIILVGGRQAELLNAEIVPKGVLRFNDSDTRRASHALRMAHGTDRSLFWCQMQARHLLHQNWHRIDAIASELEQSGEILF